MWEQIAAHEQLWWWLGALSVVSFVGALLIIPVLVTRMRADYFVSDQPTAGSWRAEHPAIRWTLLVLKNLLGIVLLLAGIAMIFLPGQGLLTMFIGLSLLNFPGKRRLEIALLRNPIVWRPICWIRRKADRPMLQLPDGVRH